MIKFQTKLKNYKNALARLHEGLKESKSNCSLTMRDGIIWRFRLTMELALKAIREYLLSNVFNDVNTPKNVMKAAFAADIITNEDGWITILRDRNSTSHIYDEDDANEVSHIKLFDELLNKLSAI